MRRRGCVLPDFPPGVGSHLNFPRALHCIAASPSMSRKTVPTVLRSVFSLHAAPVPQSALHRITVCAGFLGFMVTVKSLRQEFSSWHCLSPSSDRRLTHSTPNCFRETWESVRLLPESRPQTSIGNHPDTPKSRRSSLLHAIHRARTPAYNRAIVPWRKPPCSALAASDTDPLLFTRENTASGPQRTTI